MGTPAVSIKKRLLKSSSYLIITNFIVGLLNLLTISVIAKSLPTNIFGSFAIIQAYAATVSGILSFKTWQTVIKYFPETQEDDTSLKSLFKFSYKVDVFTAFSATILAFILLPLLSSVINYDSNYLWIGFLYLFTILFNIEGTATGYFRSADMFNIFLITESINAFLKLLIIYLVSVFNADIKTYIFVFVLFTLTRSLMLNSFFAKKVGLRFFIGIFSTPTSYIQSKFRDIKEFSIFSGLTSSFDTAFKQGDLLIVSAFFGSNFAAAFKMIKSIGALVLQIITPIYLSIYPLVSEKKSNINELRRFINRTSSALLLAGVAGFIIFYFIHEYLISIFFGTDYMQYSVYLLTYVVPFIITGAFSALHSAFTLLGYHRHTLYLLISTSVFYVIMIYVLKDLLGFYAVLLMLVIHAIIIVSYKYIIIQRHKG